MILNRIKESIEVKNNILKDPSLIWDIRRSADVIVNAYKDGKKVMLCGNGGSAADAQHLSAELSGRFKFDRRPLDADALHTNSSHVTAVANDYGYEHIFSRLVEAKGKKGDVLIGLSTSGNSVNVIKAFELANKMGLETISLCGMRIGNLSLNSNIAINVPSNDTARIQECHIMIGHIICEIVEKELFG